MRSTSILFTLTATLGLCALRCSSDETTLPSFTGGTSNGAAGSHGVVGGTAGSAIGTGGTAAGRASNGGNASLGTGGATSGATASGGALSSAAGNGAAAGTLSLGAGAGGGGAAGAAGRGSGGFGFGRGGAAGTVGIGVSMSGNGGSGMAGGSAGAGGAFAAVEAIITKSCGTTDCHPNTKGQHANLHNADGKLLDRLLATTTKLAGAKAACATLPLVVPGSPETSLIMAMIVADDSGRTDCGARMPDDCPDAMKGTVCLTDAEIETIRSWIAAGALP